MSLEPRRRTSSGPDRKRKITKLIVALLLTPEAAFPQTSLLPGSATIFTATYNGAAQIFIAGITPSAVNGSNYSLSQNDTNMLQNQVVNVDGTLYFEGAAGVYQLIAQQTVHRPVLRHIIATPPTPIDFIPAKPGISAPLRHASDVTPRYVFQRWKAICRAARPSTL
jgi:hypothetical protein